MTPDRHKLDLYVPEQHVPDLLIAHLLQKHQVQIIGQGFSLHYINVFGAASQAAIDELSALPHVFVNRYPPEIQAEIDAEFEEEES
jgi:hypothetical protein